VILTPSRALLNYLNFSKVFDNNPIAPATKAGSGGSTEQRELQSRTKTI